MQTFVLIPHIAAVVTFGGWQSNVEGWCCRLVYALHGSLLKFSETVSNGLPSWGHATCL